MSGAKSGVIRQGSQIKINELQAMIFDEASAGDAQRILAPPKRMILQKIDAIKKSQKNGRRLKSCWAQKPFQKHKR